MIARWLDPDSKETLVINGIQPTYQQLTEALKKHFKISHLSVRTVQRYVQSEKSKKKLITRRRGRLKITDQTSSLLSAKSQHATLLAQLAGEAIHLTGLNRLALHKTFSKTKTWQSFLGKQSGFFYRLQKNLDVNFLAGDKSADHPDDDLNHSLRLHQVTLQTRKGVWCVVLLGYEPRSHFLNAACYVLDQKKTDRVIILNHESTTKLMNSTPRVTSTSVDGQFNRHLPAKTLQAFVRKSLALMAFHVDTVFLSPSLGNRKDLSSQVKSALPQVNVKPLEKSYSPCIPTEAGTSIKLTSFCKQLTELIKNHNKEVAATKVQESRNRFDQYIDGIFNIRRLPSGHLSYERISDCVVLGNEEERKRDDEKRERENELAKFHKRTHSRRGAELTMKITPVHLACDIEL